MAGSTVDLRVSTDGGLSYVEELLERNDLPAADVRSGPGRFFVASDGGDRIGVGGLEVHGSAGLLRSVVVEASARGNGYGSAVCGALEARARAAGVERLYLLTTTAAGFFEDRGYERVDRADVPATVRETTQFADLCPSTAICLTRSL